MNRSDRPHPAGISFLPRADLLLDQLPEALFIVDPRHRVVFWNRACAQLTGLASEAVLKTDRHREAFSPERLPTLADLLLDGELDRLPALYPAAIPTRFSSDNIRLDHWCTFPTGERRFLATQATLLSDPSGKILAAVQTHRDRTAPRISEEQLAESEARLAAILGSSMDALLSFRKDLRLELFNGAAERLFGVPRAAALGRRADSFLSSRSRRLLGRFLSLCRPESDAEPVWIPEGLNGLRESGEEFPIEAALTASRVGEHPLFTLSIRDAGALRRAQRAILRLRLEKDYLEERLSQEQDFGEFLTASPNLRTILREVEQVAPTDATVLLQGETGTGKELLARAIHQKSRRSGSILVSVNCAALPKELVESELFGHEKGAFTGAVHERKGRFELADQGTLFLDEIGELPLATQAKLLRVLQGGEFVRVGGSRTLRADVRLIAATNRCLEEDVRDGRFRSDLFYRIHVFPIQIPPLRERPRDIPLLANFFLRRFASKLGKPAVAFSPGSMERLRSYSWPGNVRELQNVIERAVILSRAPLVEIDPLGAAPPSILSPLGPLPIRLREVEQRQILEALEQSRWRISGPQGAAARLGLHPNTLRFRMKKFGLLSSQSRSK
ncbi:Formate hydrogenlyase transcriptional activator [Methylacidimicrobium cyclopophantes]|uniref:Formate hydrogenlyase transcriptional activator n=1 Tax=Methylacidimicrobium cyclopophantes TaxID=1041766 RepID=A0A5E6MEY9_9BACT|nr:sigma 54-interacting transcriptional regulator [Methylacidimicrobium cyclopophantes]VVM07686.1 Formate hydrogenlyase transcriptional activator [Methylacidimicrobium cyclopophantes]